MMSSGCRYVEAAQCRKNRPQMKKLQKEEAPVTTVFSAFIINFSLLLVC
jgi:hypothetical protein